jgi:thymidylate synthase
MPMSKQNRQHVDAVLEAIRDVGGVIDRIEQRRHWIIYWRIRETKLMAVAPCTSRSASGLRNAVGNVRRSARAA